MLKRDRYERIDATLVALYGEKPEAVANYITALQRLLARLGTAFAPYGIDQVHATLVGLSGLRALPSKALLNANYFDLRGQHREMHLPRVLAIALSSSWRPLRVQIGGFRADSTYPFSSRGEHPYRRSFSFQGGAAVAMGWPHVANTYPPVLGSLRREFERVGALHKYHASPSSSSDDNDLFFVLGRVEPSRTNLAELRVVGDAVREFMMEHPIEIVIDADNVYLVRFGDPALPVETSARIRLDALDENAIAALYRSTYATTRLR